MTRTYLPRSALRRPTRSIQTPSETPAIQSVDQLTSCSCRRPLRSLRSWFPCFCVLSRAGRRRKVLSKYVVYSCCFSLRCFSRCCRLYFCARLSWLSGFSQFSSARKDIASYRETASVFERLRRLVYCQSFRSK